MSKSQRLGLRELRAGFRLVGEVCECGDEPVKWRIRLTAGICEAVGATKGFCDEEIVATIPSGSAVAGIGVHGFDAADSKNFADFSAKGGFHISPLFPVIQPVAVRAWTRTRRELIPDDRDWYGHEVVNVHQRPANMDDCIHSRQPIPRPGWSNMCNVFRPWKAKPFSERERRLVHLVHEEVAHHWRRPSAPDPADALPPRLRQVLRLLGLGDGEKQIAFKLGLSAQSIHAYIKDLHRRFDVSTRFDLLAKSKPQPRGNRLVLSCEQAHEATPSRST